MIDAYFRFPLLFLRLGGIPIKFQSVSIVNRIYNAVLMLCFYITFFAVIMDFVYIIEDIQESMKTVRLISAMAVNAWLHPYLR
jgi:hypothetical protein